MEAPGSRPNRGTSVRAGISHRTSVPDAGREPCIKSPCRKVVIISGRFLGGRRPEIAYFCAIISFCKFWGISEVRAPCNVAEVPGQLLRSKKEECSIEGKHGRKIRICNLRSVSEHAITGFQRPVQSGSILWFCGLGENFLLCHIESELWDLKNKYLKFIYYYLLIFLAIYDCQK